MSWIIHYISIILVSLEDLALNESARPGTSQDGEDARKAWGRHNRRRPVHRSWHFTTRHFTAGIHLKSKVFFILEIMSSQQYHSFLPVSLGLFFNLFINCSQGTQETNGRRHTLHLPNSLEPLPILEALSWLL